MSNLRANPLETIAASQRLSMLAEIRHRLTDIKYSQRVRRFVIKLHADIEERLPALVRERFYQGLAGRELKKGIYRDIYEITNLASLADERLEQVYVQDNENPA